ncbi:MAG: hypothetical protein K0Q51_1380, partial [Rickettsiaceae bacterium]|nr:hypothetical protein [Rickettsiaceae bacterium]
VGLIGIGIIAGAAALGIGVNIGEYFHKKMCKKREKEIRKLENEKSGILEGLTKCGFKVEKGKDKNHLIIKKYDRREYKFIPVDSLIQNKQKKLKKVNSFLSYFRFYMPGLERRLDKNIDKKLVNAAATDVIKYGQELVHQDINSRKNELDKVISSIEAERARAEQLERARGGSPIGSTTNSAYRPNLRTDPSLSLSPLHHRASASSLSSQNKAEGSKTKPAKTQQFIININNGKKEEKQKRPKPYRVDASKLAETLVKGKRKTKKPNTQTHEVNFRN